MAEEKECKHKWVKAGPDSRGPLIHAARGAADYFCTKCGLEK